MVLSDDGRSIRVERWLVVIGSMELWQQQRTTRTCLHHVGMEEGDVRNRVGRTATRAVGVAYAGIGILALTLVVSRQRFGRLCLTRRRGRGGGTSQGETSTEHRTEFENTYKGDQQEECDDDQKDYQNGFAIPYEAIEQGVQ